MKSISKSFLTTAYIFIFLSFTSVLTTAHAAVVFSDQIFLDSNWTTQVIPRGPDGTSSGSAMQVLAGGNLGPFRQTTSERDPDTAGLDNSVGVWSFFNTSYDPSTLGAITSIDTTIDYKQFNLGSLGSINAAVMQGGTVYLSFERFITPVSDWTSIDTLTDGDWTGLVQNSFFDPDNISSRPDFSSSGAPISFGWVYIISTPSENPVSRTTGFDNWSVTINQVAPIPIPAAAWLFASGIIGLVWKSRKVRQSAV